MDFREYPYQISLNAKIERKAKKRKEAKQIKKAKRSEYIFYTISRFAKKIYLLIAFLFLFLPFICSDNILLIKSSLSYFSVNTKKTTFLLPFLCVYRIVFYQIIRSTVNSYTPSVFHRLLWLHDALH